MSNELHSLDWAAYSPLPLSESLLTQGWWLGRNLISAAVLSTLHRYALAQQHNMQPSKVGRGEQERQAEAIRNDEIFWISNSNLAHKQLLEQLGQLRVELNRSLFLGLYELEAHYAHYPVGGFYRRHFDSFVGAKSRLISLVIYLNPEWQPTHAGELQLYSPHNGLPMATIAPRFGDVAVFLSEEIEHEVLPTTVNRYSVAAWFRCNSSTGWRVDPPAPGARI